MPLAPRPIADRFWSKVEKTDGCWLWTGAKTNGYGVLGAGRRGGATVKAPRLSYELAYGPIPPGMFVCHHCDNPGCVRPDHLFLGTGKDNMADAKAKGRISKPPLHAGERCHLTKLDADSVREIRRLAAEGVSQRSIAQRFDIDRSNVSAIVLGKTWKEVA